jgi:hypothetical protein
LTLSQTRWHRFWETGDTSFVSAGPMVSFLNLGGTEFGNSVAPVFTEVCNS